MILQRKCMKWFKVASWGWCLLYCSLPPDGSWDAFSCLTRYNSISTCSGPQTTPAHPDRQSLTTKQRQPTTVGVLQVVDILFSVFSFSFAINHVCNVNMKSFHRPNCNCNVGHFEMHVREHLPRLHTQHSGRSRNCTFSTVWSSAQSSHCPFQFIPTD